MVYVLNFTIRINGCKIKIQLLYKNCLHVFIFNVISFLNKRKRKQD